MRHLDKRLHAHLAGDAGWVVMPFSETWLEEERLRDVAQCRGRVPVALAWGWVGTHDAKSPGNHTDESALTNDGEQHDHEDNAVDALGSLDPL